MTLLTAETKKLCKGERIYFVSQIESVQSILAVGEIGEGRLTAKAAGMNASCRSSKAQQEVESLRPNQGQAVTLKPAPNNFSHLPSRIP